MNQKILERLLWKDARTIAPLLIAILVGILGIHFMLLVFHHAGWMNNSARASTTIAFCILLPNLLAFGAGAMLIGAEEESGSLSWLRNLPADWRLIASSKLGLAAAVLLLAWALSGLGFLAQRFFATDIASSLRNFSDQSQTWAIAAQLGFSFVLLFCGFATAYLFRSPVTALLLTVPVMVALTIGFAVLAEWVVPSEFQHLVWEQIPLESRFRLIAIVLSGLLGTFLCSVIAARWRLSGPDRSLRGGKTVSAAVEGFRPPSTATASWYSSSLIGSRPSPIAAMIWQAMRQSMWPMLIATFAGTASIVFAVAVFPGDGIGPLAVILTVIALFTLSGLSFYGDSVKRRCEFFADRGLSPTLVWSTRVIPPFLCTLIIAGSYFVAAVLAGTHADQMGTTLLAIIGGFALGQLVSQASPRPVLAFLGAPVALYFVMMAILPLFLYYWEPARWMLIAIWLGVPVLLFASWRLTGRWMQGKLDRAYTLRCAGFILLAIAIPYGLILGLRYMSALKPDAQWQQRMLSYEFPKRSQSEAVFNIRLPISRIEKIKAPLSMLGSYRWQHTEAPSQEELERFEKELAATDSIGEHVDVDDVYSHSFVFRLHGHGVYPPRAPVGLAKDEEASEEFKESCRQRDLRSMRVLLKWARVIREKAVRGLMPLNQLVIHAESAEHSVAWGLGEFISAYGADDETEALIEQFCDQDLVTSSRKNTLIKEWQRFRTSARVTYFMGEPIGEHWRGWFPFEAESERVVVDIIVRYGLDQLDRPLANRRVPVTTYGSGQVDYQLGQLNDVFAHFSYRDLLVEQLRTDRTEVAQ